MKNMMNVSDNYTDYSPTFQPNETFGEMNEKVMIGAHWNTSLSFIPLGLSLLLISLLGLFGNILGALVLSRFKLKSTYIIFNFMLALMDSTFLIIQFFIYGLGSLLRYFEIGLLYNNYYLQIIGPYLRPMTFIARTGTILFTMALAFDRYFVICWPLKSRVYWTRNVAIKVSAVIVLIDLIYNTSRWLEMKTVITFDPKTNTYQYIMVATDLRNSQKYRDYFVFLSYVIFFDFVPFTWVIYCNFAIWRGIRKVKNKRKNLTSKEKMDNSLGFMLIFVAVVFILCSLDYMVLDFLDYKRIRYHKTWSQFGNFCHTLNSALNFYLYCMCGPQFRQEFFKMFAEFVGYLSQNKIFGFCIVKCDNCTITTTIESDNSNQTQDQSKSSNNMIRSQVAKIWKPGKFDTTTTTMIERLQGFFTTIIARIRTR